MAVTTYQQWVAAGSPWSPATCIGDFAATMRGHGYTVYVLGAVGSHLDIATPEDHAPFSHTPWPGPQPYPRVLALDIMPGGAKDWRQVGEQIVADRNAGKPGTEWIKYLNYTDRSNTCWHASWQPGYARRPSSDTGHIHISARTDHVDAHTGYDPVTGDTAPQPESTKTAPAYPGYVLGYNPNRYDANVKTIQAQLRARGWPLVADGYFGAATLSVVKAFQAEKHLGVDGLIGPRTWAAAWLAPVT
jgi:hypothetical protein